jgi:predicted oxidoreductase
MKSLAIRDKEKIFDSEEFFNPINVRNTDLIKIKENMIQLLKELLKKKIIYNQLEIVLKSGKKKDGFIKNLTASDITRRIKYLKFTENIKN